MHSCDLLFSMLKTVNMEGHQGVEYQCSWNKLPIQNTNTKSFMVSTTLPFYLLCFRLLLYFLFMTFTSLRYSFYHTRSSILNLSIPLTAILPDYLN